MASKVKREKLPAEAVSSIPKRITIMASLGWVGPEPALCWDAR
jgi:hypothetical protein